jgi:Domain of unknown function (DU1801)
VRSAQTDLILREMAKSMIKTAETGASVHDFLNALADPQQRADALRILEMFQRVTGIAPKMWGPAIVGFGNRVATSASGRSVDWLLTGFSPRKANLTLYINDSSGGSDDLMAKLGKHTTGKGCIYIKRLSDVHESVVERLIERAFERVKRGLIT